MTTLIDTFSAHRGRISRLIEQYKDKPYIEALLTSWLGQVQDLENALFEVLQERNIDDSVGVQLDVLGDVVGQFRNSDDDEIFRTSIRVRILINNSEGTPEDIIRVVTAILADGEDWELCEEPPAQFRVRVLDQLTSTSYQLLYTLTNLAKPAGVRFLLSTNDQTGPSGRLRFADNGGGTTGGLAIFNDVNGGGGGGGGGFDGGKLVHVWEVRQPGSGPTPTPGSGWSSGFSSGFS